VTLEILVNQLVPYHDARFAAASQVLDFSVAELFGQGGTDAWSDETHRPFKHELLGLTADSSLPLRLRQHLDRRTPKVVAIQGWSSAVALTTLCWALENKARVILFSESNHYDHPRRWLSEISKKIVLKYCDAALVGGQDHCDYLTRLGFDESRIARGYNVIDNAHFSVSQRSDASSFLAVGRLIPVKNFETIFRAYAKYQAGEKAWELRIAGDGALESELRDLASELGLSNDIEFVGFQKYDELPELYRNAGCLVHASVIEPWGLVVNEAMAASLPVLLSSHCGCSRELLKHGENGFIFDPMDYATLANQMHQIASEPATASEMGARSSEIISRFDTGTFAKGLETAFAIATDNPKSKPPLLHYFIRLLANRPGALNVSR
jgi:glycosyltransferase involved in cell wall biosynthesis